MNWINIYGLAFVLVIMIPNIIFAIKIKDGFQNFWTNRFVETLEQIGRFSCFALMALIIPGCGFGFSSDTAFAWYLIADSILTAAYCLIWAVCFRKSGIFRALALSIIPSLLFLISGVLSQYWPLTIASIIFAPCHITISYKNAALGARR